LSGARTQDVVTPKAAEVMPTGVTYQMHRCALMHDM